MLVLDDYFFKRRGGREAEGGGLLIRYRGITSIQGSNPCLSALSVTLSGVEEYSNLISP